jgi:predicted GIY-YIG superfamily endonuclease
MALSEMKCKATMTNYQPNVGDHRLAIEADESGKYLLWRCKRSGWEFEAVLTDIEASAFLEAHTFLHTDAQYDYCRLKGTMEHYSVYIRIDPRDKTVRYVGMSKNVRRRTREHDQGRSSVAVANWVKELKAQGLMPLVEIVEEDIPDEETAWKRE